MTYHMLHVKIESYIITRGLEILVLMKARIPKPAREREREIYAQMKFVLKNFCLPPFIALLGHPVQNLFYCFSFHKNRFNTNPT